MGTKIKAVECKFAVHVPSKYDQSDLHLVKEVIHFEDGTTKPNVKLIENYKRDFWVTKKGFRNHKSKKEREHLDKLTKFSSTQVLLEENILKALGEPWRIGKLRGGLREICRSPYVYGTDILTSCLIKKEYQDRYPNTFTPFSLAVFDVETDVLYDTNDIVMSTLSFKDRVFTAINESFVKAYTNVEERLQRLLNQYLGNVVKERNIKWEVKICKTPAMCVVETFKKAHEWKPDWVAIWNQDFDIPKCLEMLKKEGIEPETVFSDPKVPKKYQYFEYKTGARQKVTASGKKSPIPVEQQWHTVITPASFYVIDAMCAYRLIRQGKGELPSYSLDYIMNKEIERGKLKFEEAEGFTKIEWHIFMQKNHPLEYVIYNVFDCVGMEMLDEKTKDLQLRLPLMAELSDFQNFKSQPRRFCDSVHFQSMEMGYVMATTSDRMGDELDELTVSASDWIIALAAHPIEDNGLQVIEEFPELRTNIRGCNADIDATAAYPSGQCVFNACKETTFREIVKIEDVSEYDKRMMGLNLSGGHTNSVLVASSLLGLPTMHQFFEKFTEDHKELPY